MQIISYHNLRRFTGSANETASDRTFVPTLYTYEHHTKLHHCPVLYFRSSFQLHATLI